MEGQALTLLQVVTVAVAIFGAITGSAGLALGIANFRRDRPMVRVSLRGGRIAINAPEYDPEKTYMIVEIANVGRRSIYLTNVSLWLPYKSLAMLHDGLRNPDTFPEGGPPKNYFADEAELTNCADSWAGIRAVVWDAAGERYVSRSLADRPSWGKELSLLSRLRLRLSWHWMKRRL